MDIVDIYPCYPNKKKEITNTMIHFNNNDHVIKIISEKKGFMTCQIKDRHDNCKTLYFLRFKKKPKLGVVYLFKNWERLEKLSIEQEQFNNHLLLPNINSIRFNKKGSPLDMQ